MGHRNCACPQPQVTRESWSSFESASTMQCSWSKVLPGASQLLRQILTQPVNGGTRFEPAVREQLSLEIDGTMQKKHSTTWKKWSPRITFTHYDPTLLRRLACDASPVEIGTVLSRVMNDGTEGPIAFPSRTLTKTVNISHSVHRSSAVKIHLPSTRERSSGYSRQASALCIIPGWLRPPNRVQEH